MLFCAEMRLFDARARADPFLAFGQPFIVGVARKLHMMGTAFLGILAIVLTFVACISWGTRYQPLTHNSSEED
jgi:hypothetical protein